MLVDELADQIIMKKLNPGLVLFIYLFTIIVVQGLQELDEIIQRPPRYGWISKVYLLFILSLVS
jgi:hypothetical protein